jgi:hypothetical protein
MQHILHRFGEPNKFDQSPYGTLCKVRNGESYTVYRQISHDSENPEWVLVEFPEEIENA